MITPDSGVTEEILDFQKRFAVRMGHRPNLIYFVHGEFAKARAQGVIEPGVVLGDPDEPLEASVRAEINAAFIGGRFKTQGRWIAQCPACPGAEYVELSLPIFMCCSCFNQQDGHAWLRVEIPTTWRRQAIEQELLKRPPGDRNWLPAESVADLRRQNREHGIA